MVLNVDNLCMGQRVMYFRPFDDVDGLLSCIQYMIRLYVSILNTKVRAVP